MPDYYYPDLAENRRTVKNAIKTLEKALARFDGGKNWIRGSLKRKTTDEQGHPKYEYCSIGAVTGGTYKPLTDSQKLALSVLEERMGPIAYANDSSGSFSKVESKFKEAIRDLKNKL